MSGRRIPGYLLHKASGQAYVKLAGKPHYLGKHGSAKSQAKYAQKIADWSAQDGGPPRPPASDLTIIELADLFRQHAATHYRKDGRPTGEAVNFDQAMRPLLFLYGEELVKDFGPLKLKRVRHLMAEGWTNAKGKRIDAWSRNNVNNQVRRLRHIFKWAVAEELAPPDLHHALCAVAPLQLGRGEWRETKRVLPVDDRHVEATLPFLPQVVRDMVRVHRLTGCRPNELCTMRPRDIDRTADPWVYRPSSHKTAHHGKDRRIFIGPKAQAVLLPYLLRDPEKRCFSPADSERKRKAAMREARKTRVQPSQRDRSKRRPKRKARDFYTKDSYATAVRRACDAADRAAHKADPEAPAAERLIPRWAPNQLRHAAATEIRKLYDGLEAAQVVLGHSKADTTQIYAERNWKLAAAVMKEIG